MMFLSALQSILTKSRAGKGTRHCESLTWLAAQWTCSSLTCEPNSGNTAPTLACKRDPRLCLKDLWAETCTMELSCSYRRGPKKNRFNDDMLPRLWAEPSTRQSCNADTNPCFLPVVQTQAFTLQMVTQRCSWYKTSWCWTFSPLNTSQSGPLQISPNMRHSRTSPPVDLLQQAWSHRHSYC